MTLKDVNWNQVYYFYEVARKLSMKEAAQVTGVSLPTVSEQIKRLETSLKVSLFQRFPRRLELTSEGETLFQYAKEMFDAGHRFLDAISKTPGYAARIGVQDSAVQALELEFLNRYMAAFAPYGAIHTFREVRSDLLYDRLTKGEFDWAITVDPNQSFRIEQKTIGSIEVLFCAAKEMEAQKLDLQRDSDLFKALPLALSSGDSRTNELIQDRLSAEGLTPADLIEIDHKELRFSLVEQGRCVSTVTANEIDLNPKLRYFRIGRAIEVPCYAVWRKANERLTSVRVLRSLLGGAPGVLRDIRELPLRSPSTNRGDWTSTPNPQ